jgi:hypothetical protein
MHSKVNAINLKENFYLSLTPPPKSAKRIITGLFRFISEPETKRYMPDSNSTFWDYNLGTWVNSARHSLRSAIRMLSGKKGDVSRVKFHIYSAN